MAEGWNDVSQWFHRLVELDPSAQERELEDLARESPELAQELRQLLEADAEGTGFEPGDLQSSSLWDEFADALEEGRRRPEISAATELRAGPFRVGEVLGRGGMAVVHRGERVDEDFRQVVAIKRLSGVDRRGVTDRLLAERRILAELRHPHIAQLIDGGTDSSGRPYLALELVEGLPIDEYCRRHRLSLSERIELFLQACDAVQYAHSKLVVHRDLKPSNVLVDERGQVKLLDFGIAKILDPQLDGGLTAREVRPLTPRYAAPEQFLGAPSTTATDVYGLGVVLYELLVGRLPYEVDGSDVDSYRRAILEQEPSDPATALATLSLRGAEADELRELAKRRRTTVRRLRRRMRGDLRAIFEMVLHKQPEHRYDSVAVFAEDLRRHLERRTVAAREPTLGYRLSRFFRRHRWATLAIALLVLSLAAGLTATLIQAREAQVQRAVAEEERNRALRVKDLMAAIIIGADPNQARQERLTAEQFLDRGVERVLEEIDEEPAFLADLLAEIAIIYRRMGSYERARTYARRVVDLQREHNEDPAEHTQALFNLSIIERELADFESAEALLQQVLERERVRFAEGGGAEGGGNRGTEGGAVAGASRVPDQRPYALHGLAKIRMDTGEDEEAKELLQRSLALYEAQGIPDDPRAGTVRGDLGFLLIREGELDEAHAVYSELLASQRRTLGERHSRVSPILFNLARIELARGNLDAAYDTFRESLAIDVEVFGPDNSRLAPDLAFLGDVELRRGHREEALRWFRRALEVQGDRDPGHPYMIAATANVARAAVALAEEVAGERRVELAQDAIALCERVLPLIEERYGAEHPRALSTRLHRLRARHLLGDRRGLDAALAELERQARAILGDEHELIEDMDRARQLWSSADPP